ncbi:MULTISPECIES: hypothetical protein [Chryseobacterium]|uniref:Uncharacterized protein n=1 Tax=Chryseobacterium taihuense TaxID=1141221 RepID=A0A4U8W9S4_9FLAO|nr:MULTISPECIES: hypothetical protein [Chryseobacterium]QQV01262.1 hypothetical protein I6I61_09085 [Chryseobacterium sp. FDAARGOS 1104]VFB02146.1 Uncharacterised protein [Chryseobacterium taihuense]
MSTTISYENEFNSSITEQQASMLNNFNKIIKNNNVLKVKEEYVNGKISDIVFYRENESIDEIFNKYPMLSRIEVANIIENNGVYIQQVFEAYSKNEGLKLRTFNVESISTGKSICHGYYNLQTGEIIPEKTEKYMYDVYGDLVCRFIYNNIGKIEKIREEGGGIFSNEFSMDYYNNVLPLFP